MKLNQVIESIENHIWTSEDEVGQLLANLIKMSRYRNVMECGVFKGQTSCYMIDALPEDGHYIGIDIEDHRNDMVKEYMSKNNGDFILGSSLDKLKDIKPNSMDLIFIDSVHELNYLRQEFKLCEPIIRHNGIIALHDCYLPGIKCWLDYLKGMSWFEVINLDTMDVDGYNRGIALVKCLFNRV